METVVWTVPVIIAGVLFNLGTLLGYILGSLIVLTVILNFTGRE